MKVVAFTQTWWDNPEQARARHRELTLWLAHVRQLIDIDDFFVVSATPAAETPDSWKQNLVQGEQPFDHPYTMCRSYGLYANSLGLAYALTHYRCDLIMMMSLDCVCGHDLRPLAEQFMASDKLIMASNWAAWIDDNFYLMKRAGIPVFLNNRKRANFITPEMDARRVILGEQEMEMIFRDRWWNPWPVKNHCRLDSADWKGVNEEKVIQKWPILIRANPSLRERFLKVRFP